MPCIDFREIFYDTLLNMHGQHRFDIVVGLLSHYPKCCIRSFVRGRTYHKAIKEYPELISLAQNDELNYVPCTTCCIRFFGGPCYT